MGTQQYDMAPDFILFDQERNRVRLSSRRGQWVLLYFYPKDDTPGCTQEACTLQGRMPDFSKLGLVILGVSPDGLQSHRKFAERFGVSFSLLSDPAREVIRLYGAWGPKTFMGREYMGVVRSSFLIDPEGRIARVYPSVDPRTHADDVWADVARLVLEREEPARGGCY